jgi:hypothetical protein
MGSLGASLLDSGQPLTQLPSSPEASKMEKLLFRRSSAVPGSMMQKSVHNNTSGTRRLIQKVRLGVTTIVEKRTTSRRGGTLRAG